MQLVSCHGRAIPWVLRLISCVAALALSPVALTVASLLPCSHCSKWRLTNVAVSYKLFKAVDWGVPCEMRLHEVCLCDVMVDSRTLQGWLWWCEYIAGIQGIQLYHILGRNIW